MGGMAEVVTCRMTVSYDGTEYAGWQIQARRRTVQGEIEAAMARLAGHRVVVIGASRTDSGVHARGQVASFRWESVVPADRIPPALNQLLPPDIRVLDCRVTGDGFNARQDCISKAYSYSIRVARVPDPLRVRYEVLVPYTLDRGAMIEASRGLTGNVDLAAFSRSEAIGRLGARGSVRRIDAAGWNFAGDSATFAVAADGFLRHSVRAIVGSLIEIGRGRLTIGRLHEAIRSGARSELAAPTMPAHGLCLESVRYESPASCVP